MSKIKENIESFRKMINEDVMFNKEQALKFLSAIEANAKELQKTIRDLKEDAFDEVFEGVSLTTIDGGIGKINYNSDNLLLQDVMENLETAIKKHTPKKVNEVLSSMN